MTEKIKIVQYDPKWNEDFEKEAKKVKDLLGVNCVAVVHVGSTAIKGMRARPMVDIMALVKDIFDVDVCDEALEAAGYEKKEQYGPLGRYLYEKKGDEISYQIQVYEEGDYDDIQKFVAFRDYIEAKKDLAEEYMGLKEELAVSGDEAAYKEGKGEFVKKVLCDAIPWHERQHKKNMSLTVGIILGILIAILVFIASSSLLMGIGVGVIFAAVVYFAFLFSMKKNT